MWHAWERKEKSPRFWWESPKERDHSEDQGVGGKMGVRMDLREIGLGGVDWIRLAQDREGLRAVVSAVMNLRVLAPRGWENLDSADVLLINERTVMMTTVRSERFQRYQPDSSSVAKRHV
jgi:hypothetical protein